MKNDTIALSDRQGIHQLFEDQVDCSPQKVAAIFKESQLTFQELNQQANQLAAYLKKLGVQSNTLVGIYMDRSLEMLISLLAVFKAGGAYVPLDPDFPKDRVAYMIENAEMPVILTLETNEKDLPPNDTHVICIDRNKEEIDIESSVNVGGDDTTDLSENLAYVIYTSGSTGKPKGVQVPHKTVVNFLISMANQPGMSKEDILFAVTTLSFDISVLELFLPICVGATVVIADIDTVSDGKRILENLIKTKTTLMQATPVTWRMLIEAGWNGEPEIRVICGGEALPRALANDLMDRSSSVWNMYGPTETTVWSTCYRLEEKIGPVMIGRPIRNTQVYILDKHMQPVPIGVKGELYIGGEGVSNGYLKRPDLTEKAFIKNPFQSASGDFIYKTGDSVRYDSNGNIEYLNRVDHQVKIRGFRIELGEIETVLNQNAAIKQSAVLVREDRPGDQRLVAYVVLKDGKSLDVRECREFLREKLPEYMIPQHFMPMAAFPMTPNGKVDRKNLPKPDTSGLNGEDYIAPETEIEKDLAEIWSSVINVKRIGLDDSFFDVGGHSILATQMISRAKEKFNIELTLRTVFEIPKLIDLARYIEAIQFAGSSNGQVKKVETIDREEIEL